MEFLFELGLFAAKSFLVVLCVIVVIVAFIALVPRKQNMPGKPIGHLQIQHTNEFHNELQHAVDVGLKSRKEIAKERKAEAKERKKQTDKRKQDEEGESSSKRTLFVLDFVGDIEASKAENLRKEISALLIRSSKPDEVLVRLQSAGGLVHSYGFAASQLSRIREKGIKLTVAVDQVAASGGYMMAAVANQIIAAPFALVGSIGVAAELPNFHRLMKKFDIDYEVLTAGEHKRTMTVFGENTDEGRKKLMEEIEDAHVLFRDFVSVNRTEVDVDKVATGEAWYGQRARDLGLVDKLQTSDQYILDACNDSDVYEVRWEMPKKSLGDLIENLNTSATRFVQWIFKRGI